MQFKSDKKKRILSIYSHKIYFFIILKEKTISTSDIKINILKICYIKKTFAITLSITSPRVKGLRIILFLFDNDQVF